MKKRIASGVLCAVVLCIAAPAFAVQGYVEWQETWTTGLGQGSYWTDLAVDAAGNVYVAGVAHLSVEEEIYGLVTAKYGPDGTNLWMDTYYPTTNGPFYYRPKIAVAPTGDVFVTAPTWNESYNVDLTVVHYAADGSGEWSRNYDAGVGGSQVSYGIDTDTDGNAYVIAEANDTETTGAMLTVSYDASGNLRWDEFSRPDGYEGAQGYRILVDSSNDVYCYGFAWTDSDDYAILVTKYDSSGNAEWEVAKVTQLGGGGNLAALPGGGVAVSGVQIGASYEALVFTLDEDGQEGWTQTYTGDEYAYGAEIESNAAGDVFLLTISCNETEEEYIPQLLVYNSAGTLVRTTDIALPDGFGPQEEMRLTLSADGSVYVYIPVVDVVVYRFSGVVAKVDSSGTVAWTYLYVPPSNFYASLPGFGVYDPVGAASDTKVYVSGAYSPDYSMNEATVILIGEEDETLVDLTSFTAEADDDVAVIRWETAAEPDNAGFHLLRSRAENGTYVRITDSLIAAEGDGFTGAAYEYTDDGLADGTYFYKLEAIDLTGASEFFGPVDVTIESDDPSFGCGS